jgi:hypothetical protein
MNIMIFHSNIYRFQYVPSEKLYYTILTPLKYFLLISLVSVSLESLNFGLAALRS